MKEDAAQHSVLHLFFICEAEDSVEWNICHTQSYGETPLREKAAAAYQALLAQVIDCKTAQLVGEQAHKVQVFMLFQLYLQQRKDIQVGPT